MTTFTGDDSANIFTGGEANDIATGNGGDDQLSGVGGDDDLSGGSGSDTLDGGDGNDILFSGNRLPNFGYPYAITYPNNPNLDSGIETDVLNGGAGSDYLFGGYNDILDGGSGGDIIYLSLLGAQSGVTMDFRQMEVANGTGVIRNFEAVGWLQGTNFADNFTLDTRTLYSPGAVIFAMGGDDRVTADYYTRYMSGGDGDDILDGRGSQYMSRIDGDAGNDTIYVRENSLAVSTYGGDGDDTIYAGSDVHGGAGNDKIILQFTYYGGGAFGDEGDDEIRAASNGGIMVGGSGADLLVGAEGVDIISSADFKANGSAAEDDMGLEKDILSGAGNNDTLAFGYGDDADGGAGNDTLVLSLGGALTGVTFNSSGITGPGPFVFAGGTITNFEVFKRLRGSDFADTLTIATHSSQVQVDGGDGDDVVRSSASSIELFGGTGNDRFVSGIAGDVFDGGAGIDTIDYSEYANGVTVSLALAGQSGQGAGGDSLINVENILGSAFADTLSGSNGANDIRGGGGADSLNGNDGNDELFGEIGDDKLSGGRGSDRLVGGVGADELDGGDGEDTADYSGDFGGILINLAAGVGAWNAAEGDRLTGVENVFGTSFADGLTGDGKANWLAGNGGDDVLHGGGGADRLDGGAGIDIADYSGDFGAINVNLALGTGAWNYAEGDVLIGIEHVTGTAFNDVLTGDAGVNRLVGGDGDDRLHGGGGGDELIGGAGNDTVDYAGDFGAVVVNLSTGVGTWNYAEGDTYVGIENVVGTTFNDVLQGDDADNRLTGGAGADILVGGGGVDTADYAGALGGVSVNLAAGTGSLGDAEGDVLIGIENATGTSFNDILTGNAGINRLDGGNGDDLLHGGAGADVLIGGAGIDTADYAGNFGAVIVNLAAGVGAWNYAEGDVLTGVENVSGTEFNDVLTGNAGGNRLVGNGGDDLLHGGAGADVLDGGAGNDTADYAGDFGAVIVNLATGIGAWNYAEGDTYAGIENVIGTSFKDILQGNDDDNRLTGGGGDDRLVGGGGADLLDGGAGSDTIDFTGAFGGVAISLRAGQGNWNTAEGDRYVGIENVVGTSFNDIIEGDANGNLLTGGGGDDLFSLRPGFGIDTITDFVGNGAAAGDRIQFQAGMFTGFADLLGRAAQQGNDVVITLDPGNILTLLDVQLGALNADDFLF